MVGINFPRPVGPFADTKELEYISALHQAGEPLRQNGTIQASDICCFLKSRHGVEVEECVIMQAMMLELGGSLPVVPKAEDTANSSADDEEQGRSSSVFMSKLLSAGAATKREKFDDEDKDEEDDDEEEEEEEPQPVLDICQLLALLLIPFLREGNEEPKNMMMMSKSKSMLGSFRNNNNSADPSKEEKHCRELVGHVLELALRNVIGEFKINEGSSNVDDENNGIVLTPKILRRILETFGEFDIPHDVLVEMIRAAKVDPRTTTGGDGKDEEVFLNKAAFLQALTSDTQLWNPKKIDGKASTHFKDAMKAHKYREEVLYGSKNRRLDRRRPSQLKQQPPGAGTTMDDESMASLVEDPTKLNANALPYKTVYTAASIDNNADNYRNGAWFVWVWFETVLIYFAYLSGSGIKFTQEHFPNCKSEFGCKIAISILTWITVFAELSAMGLTWVFLASLGNANQSTKTVAEKAMTVLRLTVSMTIVTIVTIVTMFVDDTNALWDTVKVQAKNPAYWTAFLGGILILFFQLARLVSVFYPLGPLESGGMGRKEQKTKLAATNKVQTIVEHALILHDTPPKFQSLRESSVSETVRSIAAGLHSSDASGTTRKSTKISKNPSTSGKALLNFHRMNDTVEVQGGVFWTAKQLLNGSLFLKEGIYLHGRLLAVNLVQFFICALMISTFVFFMRLFDDNLKAKDDGCTFTVGEDFVMPDYDPNWNRTTNGFRNEYNINATHFGIDGWLEFEGQLPKFNGTTFQLPDGITSPTICWDTWTINATGAYPNDQATLNQIIEMLELKPWQWKLAGSIGLLGSFLGVSSIALVYVPSFVSQVIKLRSGFNASLKGDYESFLMFRKSPDATAILFGCNLWGCFYTALVAGFFFGAVGFLMIWPMTRSYVFTFIAGYTGLVITIGLKVVIMKFLRSALYKGYYRIRPAAANFTNVILECWSLGLSAGTVTSRFIKLFVVTGFYVGRIDTPVFAPGVGYVAGSPLDPAPHSFYKDLLLHEAHRHPFIERLGLLYLLKLNNGKQFGHRAGAHWRILFVLALLPWMRNYRVRDGHERLLDDDDDDEELSPREQLQKEFNKATDEGSVVPDIKEEMDVFGMQLELDVTRRAYEKMAKRNRELKAALRATKEKAREVRRENKSLRHSVQESTRGSLAAETLNEAALL